MTLTTAPALRRSVSSAAPSSPASVPTPHHRLAPPAGDIQLPDGDTFDNVTENVTLPITLTVDGNTLNLTWSVHHDPETTDTNKVTISGGTLIVNPVNRVTPRWIILRATTGSGDSKTLVNDYTLRITLARPKLRLTAAPGHLLTGHTTQFTATSGSEAAITWSIAEGGTAATIDPNTGIVTASATAETITVQASVAQTTTHAAGTVTTSLEIDDFGNFEKSDFADYDRDGLIEIHDLAMLHNMRYNLAGTSYKESANDVDANTLGCPDTGCNGYELMRDLDFDRDNDGTTWSGDSTRGYTLDSGDSQAPWFITANGGWEPIGDCGVINGECLEETHNDYRPFTATFEGNGYMIRNLAIRRNQSHIGLFGYTDNATIRNLGLEQALADYTGSTEYNYIAPLVGWMEGGAITASYATGAADGGDGDDDYVGGLVGRQIGGTLIASYATGTAHGRGGDYDSVGGLVGEQSNATLIASYATGTVHGGAGERDDAGGLVGYQDGGTLTASYATGNVDGGDGDYDEVGSLIGSYEDDDTTTVSYGFGTRTGGEADGIDRSQSTTATSAAALTLATAGAQWSAIDSGTQGAWDFGDGNQPPALLYNDYDGTSDANDIDYCALFAAAHAQCGTLIPGQRASTIPQFGIGEDNIQLTDGNTTSHITANILLPTTLTVGDNTLDLMWSVHHDPETTIANKVTLSDGQLIVNADNRTFTRWIILRVTTGTGDNQTLVNDYRLRIVQGNGGGLPSPGLRLTSAVDTLLLNGTHRFAATSLGDTPITWSVTAPDNGETTLATIEEDGTLTANGVGQVKVTASVAADTTHRAASASHTVAIRIPTPLTLTTTDTLVAGEMFDFTASDPSTSGRAITWSVTNPDGTSTDLAMIDASSGRLTAQGAGMVKVTASVAEDDTYSSATASHTLTITHITNTLAFTAPVSTLEVNASHSFAATSDSSGAISYTITDVNGSPTTLATINPTTGALTASGAGRVKVTATVAADTTHSGATASHTLEITRLASTLTLASTPDADTLAVRGTHTFIAMTDVADDTRSITWRVTDTGDAATDRADIGAATGLLTARKAGMVKVTATVAADRVYTVATTSYTFTIARLPSTLALITATDTLAVNGAFTFEATNLNSGAITWEVTNTDGTSTDRAEINDSGQLTGLKGTGMVRVTASVVADDIYTAGSVSHDVTLNRLNSDLAFDSTVDELDVNANHTFVVSTDSTGAITWEVTNTDGTSTDRAEINDSGQLTALKGGGMVRVTASVVADDIYTAGSVSHDVTLNRLDSDLAFDSTVDELDVNATHTFAVSTDSTGAITWEVTNTDSTSTDLAEINDSGQLVGLKGTGMVRVTASVVEDDTYATGSVNHDVTINRITATITLADYSRSLLRNASPVTLTATTNSAETITWSGSNASVATLTDNGDNTATLTPVAAGVLTVTAEVAQSDTHTGISVTSDTITINELDPPNLMITGSPPAILAVMDTHTFTVTHLGSGAITWNVTDTDGGATDLATIDEGTGVLTANKGGMVKVIATVAEEGRYSTATASHDLELTRLANTLTLTLEGGGDLPNTLEVDATHDFAVTRLGTGAITWSVTDTDDGATDLATIDEGTGVLISNKGGKVKVVATVAQDDQYESATATHTLELTRLANTLTFTSPAATVDVGDSVTFTATHSGSGAITWSVTGTDDGATDLATINENSGVLISNKGGRVKIVATAAQGDRYAATTASHDLELTRLANTLTLTLEGGGDLPGTLEVDATHDFATTRLGTGAITWSVTDTDDGATDWQP